MSAVVTTVIHGDVIKIGQAYEFTEVVKFGDHKVRIFLHRDSSYQSQSYARSERWDGTQWRQVMYYPGEHSWLTDLPKHHRNGTGDEYTLRCAADELIQLMLEEAVAILT